MTATTTRDFEGEARAKKVGALVEVLAAHGATSAQAAVLATDATARATVEALAGTHKGSDKTWAQVVKSLAGREAARANFGADPFANLNASAQR